MRTLKQLMLVAIFAGGTYGCSTDTDSDGITDDKDCAPNLNFHQPENPPDLNVCGCQNDAKFPAIQNCGTTPPADGGTTPPSDGGGTVIDARDRDDDGDRFTENQGDCNDTDGAIHPNATEVCNGKDDNCSGDTSDEFNACLKLVDNDGDGFCEDLVSCKDGSRPGDCNDQSAAARPGAIEVCDSVDNNCDGNVDEGLAVDADGDKHYKIGTCGAPADDCDDADPTRFPGNPEICDGKDNDCDGAVPANEADRDLDGVRICAGDCNDADATVKPGAVEACNGRDDDCDGTIPVPEQDLDQDTFLACGGTKPVDCEDRNPFVNPDALERCNNGADDNCDGVADEATAVDAVAWYRDLDLDGFGDNQALKVMACKAPTPGTFSTNNLDCQDTDDAVKPGAIEKCDTIDNNCDGRTDEPESQDAKTWYPDSDADGHGSMVLAGVKQCTAPTGYVALDDDCDDTTKERVPGKAEICDGIDNDCQNGIPADELDFDSDGVRECAGDCDDTKAAVKPGVSETCNGTDDDCDGAIDEGATDAISWYPDADADGKGDKSAAAVLSCTVPPGTVAYVRDNTDCADNDPARFPGNSEVCDGKDNDCTGTPAVPANEADADGDLVRVCAGDCDDTKAAVKPGASETCNGTDDDCDGNTDEAAVDAVAWYPDSDGDGKGNTLATATLVCGTPVGFVKDNTDCNDTDPAVKPGAVERCNGLDDNCDGAVPANEADADQDGKRVCDGDTVDTNDTVYPGAPEVCDGLDNDLDGTADEEVANTYYKDGDSDGFGDPNSPRTACTKPAGYVENQLDCGDANAAIKPGATDTCGDGIDQNCDGVDATCPSPVDSDGDGFTPVQGDCNDADNSIYPGAPENTVVLCTDGKDNDCDGNVDSLESSCSADADGDGFTLTSRECNDANATVHPGAAELCDIYDNDCDGVKNEGCPTTDIDGDGVTPFDGDCDDNRRIVGPGALELCGSTVWDLDCDGVKGASDPDAQCLGTLTYSYSASVKTLTLTLNGNVMGTAVVTTYNTPRAGTIQFLEVGSDFGSCWDETSTCGQTAFLGDNTNHTLTFGLDLAAPVPLDDWTPRARTDATVTVGGTVHPELLYLLLNYWRAVDGNASDGTTCVVQPDFNGTALVVHCS
jgi:hypothetical protein